MLPPPGALDLELGLVGCRSRLGASAIDGFAGLGPCFMDYLGSLVPDLIDCRGSLGLCLMHCLSCLLVNTCLVQ